MDAVRFQGACLYMPATHAALPAVAVGERVPGLGAAVICFEDALDEADVDDGLAQLRALSRERPSGLALYVRPRSVAMLEELLAWEGHTAFAGFVLPKIGIHTVERWLRPLASTTTRFMPILETADIFDPFKLRDLTAILAHHATRIDAVRIGAVDLFGVLGVRRPLGRTIYDTVLGPTLRLVAAQLMAQRLPVAAPVCESLIDDHITRAEVALDVEAGFVGKTAVHPAQVVLINAAYRVKQAELDEARRVLTGPAVFAIDGRMTERAPHRRWAEGIIARAERFGVERTSAFGAPQLDLDARTAAFGE